MMKKSMGFTFVTAILTLMIYCDKDVNSPEKLVPGNRNYIWELDTLDMPMNRVSSIWGASPTDVWAVGYGGNSTDRLMHYDGMNWTRYRNELISVSAHIIFGFNANDIWMGGQGDYGAGLWHFDGNQWTEYYEHCVDGASGAQITDIWGKNSSDIYACGIVIYTENNIDKVRGLVLHFDGLRWQEVVIADFNSQFHKIRQEGNNVYVFSAGLVNGRLGNLELYKVKKNKLIQIYSKAPETGISMYSMQGDVYFVIGCDVFRYFAGFFAKQFSFRADMEFFGYTIYARHPADQFVRMRNGICHYDGNNLEYIYKFPKSSMNITDAVLFKDNVFFSDYRNNIVVHGRLQE